MELKRCSEAHLDEVTALYHRTIAHLQANINYPCWTQEHPSDRGIRDSIAKGEQYICTDGDTILGALMLNEDPEGCYERGDWSVALDRGDFLVVHALAVDPELQVRGIGSFMVEQCIALAREGGYKAIRLDIVPGNIPAERLYRKHGFTYAGTKDLLREFDYIPLFELYELNL